VVWNVLHLTKDQGGSAKSMHTIKKVNLDEAILEIVRKMQPISSDEIWWEIGENLNSELMPSQIEVKQRLKEMVKIKILKIVRLNSEREKYTFVEK